MSSDRLEAIVKVIAYGVPALLIVLGFFAVLGGIPLEEVWGNPEMKNIGIAMIVIGIIIYIIELIVYFSR